MGKAKYERGEDGIVRRVDQSTKPRHPNFDSYWATHKNLVWWCARKAAKTLGGTPSEYIGILTLRFNNSLYSFDEEKGRFSTYFYRRLFHDVFKMHLRYESDKNALKFAKEFTSKRDQVLIHNTAMMQHTIHFRPEEDRTGRIEEIMKCFDTPEELWQFLCKGMDRRWADILWLRYKNKDTYNTIAQTYSVTKQRVEQIVNQALSHIKKRVGNLDSWIKLFKVEDRQLGEHNFPDFTFGEE